MMDRLRTPLLAAAAVAVVFACAQTARSQRPVSGTEAVVSQDQAFLNQYCIGCHNSRLNIGNLAIDQLDLTNVAPHAESWEKVVRKLRAGMMPPSGAPRPDRAVIDAFALKLENALDAAAAQHPNPGVTALHRLNRSEYGNAIRDLLGLEVDVSTLLPADDSAEGFDNVADVLRVSPSLMDRYISTAAKISRLAVGDLSIAPATATYRDSDPDVALPFGAYRGIVVQHYFPLDGRYSFQVKGGGGIPYDQRASTVEISVDGEKLAETETSYYITGEAEIPVQAGLRTVAFSVVDKDPQDVSHLWKVVPGTVGPTAVYIAGPLDVTGPGDTPSRRKIFTCRPTGAADEVACAKQILGTLARRAYRGPVTDAETETLLGFYQRGRNQGDFETGIEMGIQRMLVSPRFIFRFEQEPADLAPGSIYEISDLELASRLSFFIWSSIPDDELLDLAAAGRLHEPGVLEQQARRMLADPRSEALVDNFAGQWLFLRGVKNAPAQVNGALRQSLQKETELLVKSIVDEDRDVLDLLNADYTFVNETLARHYGIPNIYGDHFRRVPVREEARKGLLGQGSLLLVTSLADRTSPVARGKWILENLLGVPAPTPPPNVPALEESASKEVPQSVRQQMELHRRNPVCASCHKIMDPIGLALENFDKTGHWRDFDQGVAIDASGELVDGTSLDGPVALREALLSRSDVLLTTMTEKLMTYGVGRGVRYFDMPAVRAIVREAADDGNRFSSLVVGIVESDPFLKRMKAPAASAANNAAGGGTVEGEE